MAKDKLTDYDATAGNNTDVGGITIDEGMLPSNVNNAIREVMSHLKDFAAGTEAVTSIKTGTLDMEGGEIILDADGDTSITADTDDQIDFKTGGSDRVTIDSSGNVGIGTSSPDSFVQTEYTSDHNVLTITTGGGNIAGVALGDTDDTDIGGMYYLNSADALYFYSNASERLRIRDDGNIGIGTAGAASVRFYVKDPSNTAYTGYFRNEGASYNGSVLISQTERTSSSAFFLAQFYSNSDVNFSFRGDGYAFSDGSFAGGGADYAEYFEWDDDNTNNEDRRGYSVVLTNGNKIRKATSSDAAADIIGVISGNPSVVGDAAWNKWVGKYNRDDFNSYITESYTVTEWTETDADGNDVEHSYETDKIPSGVTAPADATVLTQDADGNTFKRRQLNSSYDDTQTYTPREDRQEWDAVGMMGKLRLRAGQPTGDRWIKMRDIATDDDGNVTVEEWLVR